ncbi:MAG: hypothetical protein IPJ41_18385 [Phycisphaerales bacterium]|nr:hypothetical protein [Phycisphaerales bacterium]
MKHHVYPTAVPSLLLVLALAPTASAQCEDAVPFDCAPPNADDAFYLNESGGTNSYSTFVPPPLVPDRRPGFFIQMSASGNRDCNNPLDQIPWWQSANWTGFERQLDLAWDNGFRRVVLYKPGGSPGYQKVQQAQYQFLMNSQKQLLANEFSDWLADARAADASFELGVVVGAWQSGGVCTPCLDSINGNGYWKCDDDDDLYGFTYNPRFFDPTNLASMQETYQNLIPWVELGCDSIWLDNCSNHANRDVGDYKGPQRLLDAAQDPDYAGVELLGEAIPTDANGYVDTYMAEHAAWFAHLQFLMGDDDGLPPGKGWLTGGSHDDQVINPDTTELIVLFGNPDGAGDGPPYTIATMADARDRGYIPWATATDAVPLIQRLFDGDTVDGVDLLYQSFITHNDLADFNGDHSVTCADFLDFFKCWSRHSGGPRDPKLAIYDGDLDNDDMVTTKDLLLFLRLRNWSALGCF